LSLATGTVRAALAMLSAPVPVPVPSMMEEVHQETSQDEQIRKDTQQVRPVFSPQEEGRQRQEPSQRPFPAAVLLLGALMFVHVVHDVLQDEREAHSTPWEVESSTAMTTPDIGIDAFQP
jgi:hypothetical protein